MEVFQCPLNTAFQGVLSNDKCVICLPRQHLTFCEKSSVYAGLRARVMEFNMILT